MSNNPQSSAYVCQYHDILFETHQFAVGKPEVYPRHAHEDYQIYLSMSTPASYFYRGAWHTIPPQSMFVLHSGEMHEPRSLGTRETQQNFQLVYISPKQLRRTATELSGRTAVAPFFTQPLISDQDAVRNMVILAHQLNQAATSLEREGKLLDALEYLVIRFSHIVPLQSRPSLELAYQVRDYLHENWRRNVSMTELTAHFNLSASYISRSFKNVFHMPPYAYHSQIRIDRARQLLLDGVHSIDVAHQIGFYDQSHFIARFKRLVGVTPSRYNANR